METSTSHIPQGLLDKIQKLMRLKDDKAASQGEIENASTMITQLLLKYNLQMSQVIGHGIKENDIGEESFSLQGKQTRHEAGWVVKLFNVVARHNMCRCIHYVGSNKDKDDMGRMVIIGSPMNIEIVYFMVDQLHIRIKDMCSDAWLYYQRNSMGDEKRNTYRRGYLRGCVLGISDKLGEQEQERIRELEYHPTLENKQMELMIMGNAEALQKYRDEHHSGTFRSKGTKLSGIGGFQQGLSDGSQMSINKGLNNPHTKRLN